MIGNITVFENAQNMPDLPFIRHCYLEKHPDAMSWLPEDDNAAHVVRITVPRKDIMGLITLDS